VTTVVRRPAPRRVRERTEPYRATLTGPVYCDTSALLKLYLPEPGSGEFNQLVESRDDVVVSDLVVTEAVSALSRRLRQGALTRDVASRVHAAIIEGLDSSIYRRVELTREVHRRAEQMLLTLTSVPLRAAEALHLALATAARAASLASFDARMTTAARAVGLAVYPA
jgi:predicted nucleic acid-binding protein